MIGIAASLGILLAGTGGYLYFGGYADQQDERSMERICHGIVPRSELKTLMKSSDLHGTDDRMPEGKAGWLDGCTVEGQGDGVGTTQFSIGQGSKAGMTLSALGRTEFAGYDGTAVPIGGGWQGAMTRKGPVANASVLLECGGADKSLLVSVRSYPGRKQDDQQSASQRYGALAALTTRTAQAAATAWSCHARTAAPTRSTPPPVTSWPGPTALGQAAGSCRPFASLASTLAQRDIQKAVETPTGSSPIEDCYLLDSKERAVYRLSAYYGPYARDLLSTHGWPSSTGNGKNSDYAWATYHCPDFFGTARFTSGIVYDAQGEASAPSDPDLQQQLLMEFAKGSADRHGCRPL
ncbi:hypothetical protein ACPCTO_18190 [Streptomyces olivoreticuli]